jgi:uncharacterized protein YoxC
MNEDPRRAIVEVMARLGKETQLHLDERHRHFKVTDAVTITVSILLVVLAIFNIYYVRVLYKNLDGIVNNMDSMYDNIIVVDKDMTAISHSMEQFDKHIAFMVPIHDNIATLSESLPTVRYNMDDIKGDMDVIEQEMGLIGGAMGNMDQRIHQMLGSMSVMRNNMRQMANPMGVMNPVLP